MSATDELRTMLDERGVKYETDDTQVSDTEWYYVTKLRDGYRDRWTYEEPPECGLLLSYQYDLSAEDAIEATLGRGTCHIRPWRMEHDTGFFDCMECDCGYVADVSDWAKWHYCPNCGSKVV